MCGLNMRSGIIIDRGVIAFFIFLLLDGVSGGIRKDTRTEPQGRCVLFFCVGFELTRSVRME